MAGVAVRPLRKGEPAIFLHQRMLPEPPPVGGESRQDALRALHVHVAGLRIDGRAARGIAQVDRVAQKIVVERLPKLPPAFRVEARHPLLQIGPLANITHRVEPALRQHRRRLARVIRHPQRLLGAHLLRQARLPRHARLLRAPPTQPTPYRRAAGPCARPNQGSTRHRPKQSGCQQTGPPRSFCRHAAQPWSTFR